MTATSFYQLWELDRHATLAMTMIEVFVTARKAKPDVAVHYRYAQQKTTVATFFAPLALDATVSRKSRDGVHS